MKKQTLAVDIISGLKKMLAQAKKEERVLQRYNVEPNNQHAWDQWKTISGYVDGLGVGYDKLKSLDAIHRKEIAKLRRVIKSLLTESYECGAWWENPQLEKRKQIRLKAAEDALKN